MEFGARKCCCYFGCCFGCGDDRGARVGVWVGLFRHRCCVFGLWRLRGCCSRRFWGMFVRLVFPIMIVENGRETYLDVEDHRL